MTDRRFFDVRQLAEVTIVVMSKSRYFDTDVHNLESDLLDLVRGARPEKLLIDVHAIELSTNAIHSVLLKAKRAVESNGGELKLCSLQPLVMEIFKNLHLAGHVFDIHDSMASALDAFTAES